MKIKLSFIFLLMFMAPIVCAGSTCASADNRIDTVVTKKTPLRIAVDLAAKNIKLTMISG